MKSLNTKKIVAMATGAALLGSALLGAVSYKNTELINDNGVPMAKVVVGSNAHISDGVAAANIAAVLGNMAFKSVAVSATVDGVSGLSCDASGASAGTCSVLSKSVDLEVVTPAGVIPAGAYGFSTYIDDYVDSKLLDRAENVDTKFPQEVADVSAKKIKASDYAGLADYAVKDTQSSISATESQNLYVRSETGQEINYDVAEDIFVFEGVQLAYELEFESPGIPVCSSKTNDDWADCKFGALADIDTDKQIENHRVKIKFLGEEWIISELSPKTIGDNMIKIAKESAYSPKLQIGESLDLGDGNKLVLGDLKPASGGQLADIAIFSVMNAAGEEIASKTVAAGATTEITAGSSTYRVRVYQVAPGYTLTEKWAEVAVFANELELKDNTKLDNDDNSEWRVYLEWKQEGSVDVDHIYKVQIVSEYFNDVLETGDSINIIENPSIWRLTFTGLDLTEADYTNVDFSLQNRMNYWDQKVEESPSIANRRSFGNGVLTTKTAIKMSSTDKAFEVKDLNSDTYEVRTLYFSPFGTNDNAGTADDDPIFAFEHESHGVFVADDTHIKSLIGEDTMPILPFWSNDDGATFTAVNFAGTNFGATVDEYALVFVEDNEEGFYSFIAVNARETGVATNELEYNNVQDDAEDVMYWVTDTVDETTFAAANLQAMYAGNFVETPFYAQKGTQVLSASESKVRVKFAEEVGKLSFILQATGAGVSDANTMTYSNLKEGDEIDVLGAKVKVKAIDCQTGACTTATGSATVSGIEGLSCVLNANAANLGERQNIPTDMVVMDTSATSTETVIAVGGPMVNTITEAILAGESPLTEAGAVFVDEVGAGKIVVAGYTADDTMTAAMNFIAQLKGQ